MPVVAGRGGHRRGEADPSCLRLGAMPPAVSLAGGAAALWHRRLRTLFGHADILLAARLAAVVRRQRPEVINTHSISALSPLVWAVARCMNVPVVHTLHDFASMCSNGALIHAGHICTGDRLRCRAIAALHRRLSAQVSGVVAVGTDIMQRHLNAGFFRQVPENRRLTLWNPVAPPAHRAAAGKTPGKVTFGYLGRIEHAKGADRLLDACRALPPRGWRLLMAGRTPQGLEHYRRMARGLPVTFSGHIDAEAFYAQVDCLIAPSLWPEAFGRTVAEALLRGIPVIGADTAGIAEQMRAWREGWLFAPGDTAALAAIMTDIVSGATPLARVARHPELERRLSPEHIADSMALLYRAVLAEADGRALSHGEASLCR